MYVQDPHGKVPLYWGIAADGAVAFSDDAKLLKQGCGKSFAPFPQGIYAVHLICGSPFEVLGQNF